MVALSLCYGIWKERKPIVHWKSENPRCLKRCDKFVLPVNFLGQKKAWMTGVIMKYMFLQD